MKIARLPLLVLGLLASGALAAEEPAQLTEIPEAAPPPPPPMEDGKPMEDSDQALEPDVTIVQRKDAVVEEYRLHGRLYQVKVKPFVGPTYFLVDQDGDGTLETKVGGALHQPPAIPQWVIFSW